MRGVQLGQTQVHKEVLIQRRAVKQHLRVTEHQVEQLHDEATQARIMLQQVSHETIQVEITQTTIPRIEVPLRRQAIVTEVHHLVEQQILQGVVAPQEVLIQPEEDRL